MGYTKRTPAHIRQLNRNKRAIRFTLNNITLDLLNDAFADHDGDFNEAIRTGNVAVVGADSPEARNYIIKALMKEVNGGNTIHAEIG